MKTLSIDIETYSSTPLQKSGVYRYMEAPDFEILLFGYSVDTGPVQVIDLACGEHILKEILTALEDEAVIKWAFNASFERICLSRFLDYPTGDYLDPESWRCSMIWAATMGLPLSLEGVGVVLGLEKQKLSEGKDLIKYFCQPCAPTKVNGERTRNRPFHAPEKWADFKRYNIRDVETEMGIQQRLHKFPVPEMVWDEYHLDQQIHDTGVRLNLELVKQALEMIIYSYKPQPYAEELIYQQISDITISMKSTDHLQMPELISSQYEVKLSKEERQRYEELKKALVLQLPDSEVTAANAASLTGKLSQLANGAIYADTGDTIEFHDRKLDALEDILEAANGKPVLVAYWFKHDLKRLKRRFTVREIKESQDITDWNAGKIPVAVIHPASAGHGLNLQAGGSTLIWFGLTWSLELCQQTNARLWRQGQTSGTVVIEHIITKGTIDERILKALSQKELTQTALIDAVKTNL